MNKLIGFLGVFLSLTTASMAQKVDVSIFPKPEKGYKQMVIEVPHSKLDDNKKIEFTIGKMMEVDGCNSFGLMGKLEKKDLQGWGYDYYVFQSKGDVFSTQMACPDAPKRNLFVSSQPETTRYNGRMPIVIYVPEEFEVKFKIYTAGQDEYEAQEVRIKK
ncbi:MULTISPECIES: ecotin [unclassified Myroides]|uniref:ecotin n=1 Tax=unclassified Myroides TaxID=2642485 RepID=UPI003D2F5E48